MNRATRTAQLLHQRGQAIVDLVAPRGVRGREALRPQIDLVIDELIDPEHLDDGAGRPCGRGGERLRVLG